MILAIPQGRRSASSRITRLLLGAVKGSHSTIFDDAIDGCLDFGTTSTWASDLALSEGTTIGSRQELDTAIRVSFDPSQILSLAADDEANQTGLYLNRLGVVITTTSQRRSFSASGAATRGKGAPT